MEEQPENPRQFETVHAEHGSAIQRLTVVLPEDARGYLRWINGMSIGLALAIVLSLFAAMFCFFAEYQEQRRVYFTQRCETFIELAQFHGQPIPYAICGAREK